MKNVNEFFIRGSVVKAVELRHTAKGTPVTTIYVVTATERTDSDGEIHIDRNLVPVTVYGKAAENHAKYLKKGSLVEIKGSISSWYKADENKGGFNFVANDVRYLDRAAKKEAASTGIAQPSVDSSADHDGWIADYERSQGN